jgi:hypothetical protein
MALLLVVSDASAWHHINSPNMSAALVLSKSPRQEPAILRASGGPRHLFAHLIPRDSLLISLELLAPQAGGGAGRVRFGAAPPDRHGRLAISDVAFFEVAGGSYTGVTTVDSLMPRMLATTKLKAGSAVGIFWEVYGLSAGERPAFTVSVAAIPPQPGASRDARNAQRAAVALGRLDVTWTDRRTASDAQHFQPRTGEVPAGTARDHSRRTNADAGEAVRGGPVKAAPG